MDCRTTSWSKAGQRAFTLPEMVAGLGLSGFLVAVISALSLFSGINFACIVNYAEMNTDSVNAMNAMNYEIRRADAATSYTTNSVTVSNATTVGENFQIGSVNAVDPHVLGFNNGIVLAPGKISTMYGPNSSDASTTVAAGNSDADLTTQVRAIAEVATAVTQGDLTRSISVVAQGEVVLVNERYGIRLTRVVPANERLRNL